MCLHFGIPDGIRKIEAFQSDQVGQQSAVPWRNAWLVAALTDHVPAATIDRCCGSGQRANSFAAQGVIDGGLEPMSRVLRRSARTGSDPRGLGIAARFALWLVRQCISTTSRALRAIRRAGRRPAAETGLHHRTEHVRHAAAKPRSRRGAPGLAASVPHLARLGTGSDYASSNPTLNGETIRLNGALRMAFR